jgi:zinc and cadmium transporter
MRWSWPLLAGLAASTATLIGSLLILTLGRRAERLAVWLLAFAIGALLGAATLGLLPEALRQAPGRAMPLFLAGIVGFIVIERLLRWRHLHQPHHGMPHPPVERATVAMILGGDAVHNFVDGLVLGVAFQIGPEVGLATALAIFAHEVPQEVGDFAILLSAGLSRRRALALNYLVALSIVPGTLLSFAWAGASDTLSGWLLPIAAGGFVYIALADLVPALHHRRGALAAAVQIVLVVAGIAIVGMVGRLAG